MTRSSDVVAMDVRASDSHMVSFGKKSGCFVSRSVVWLFAVLFVSGLVATGLLVYFFAPHFKTEDSVRSTQTQVVVEQIPVSTGLRRPPMACHHLLLTYMYVMNGC